MTNNQSKNKDLIVGLDIGTSKVVCLVGRYDSSDNLEILSLGTYPSSGLKKGVVVNLKATTDAIEKAVEHCKSLIDEKIRNSFVGIAGNH
jgi:Actin-like ATPase involved in cell division